MTPFFKVQSVCGCLTKQGPQIVVHGLNYARTVSISKTKDTSFEIKSFMCIKLVHVCKVVHVRQSSLCA